MLIYLNRRAYKARLFLNLAAVQAFLSMFQQSLGHNVYLFVACLA